MRRIVGASMTAKSLWTILQPCAFPRLRIVPISLKDGVHYENDPTVFDARSQRPVRGTCRSRSSNRCAKSIHAAIFLSHLLRVVWRSSGDYPVPAVQGACNLCRSSQVHARGAPSIAPGRRPSNRGRGPCRRKAFRRALASVPIPKFVSVCSTLCTNFGITRDTSNVMILVWFLDLKFLHEPAAGMIGTSNPPY
jgi:hypothetical protein